MKRILLSSITILYWAASYAQIESTINVPYTTSASPTYKALLYLPSDYSTTTKNYPLLVFSHSASEAADGASTGTGLAKIYNQASYGGPAYFIEHGGWPASFTNPVNGVQEQFIVVSPQASTWSMSGDQLANVVNYLVATYRVDINRIHLTGVSAGGAGVAEYAAQMDANEDAPSLTKDVRKYKPADIVPMSQASNDPTQTWGNIDVSDSIPMWGFGDPTHDLYGGFEQDMSSVINKAKSGYAIFTSFTTGHGPWNPFYNPTYTQNFTWRTIKVNYSIYSWMLGNSRVAIPIVPVANAGSAQTITLPASTVTLTGSGSTGNITSYAWTQVSGPAGDTIKTPTAVSTSVTGLVQGVYVFQLTVTGGSTSTVQITVSAAPPPPVANAGAAQTITLPTSTVTLSGSGSTGTITSYAWTQVSGPSTATIATPTTVSTKISALVQGNYVFQLALNGGSKSTVQVTVKPPPLVANAGSAQMITLPTNKVTLNASASSGAISSYSWTQLIGPLSDTIKSPASSSTSVTGMVVGTYTFQLNLTDNTGAVATSTVDVQVLSNTTYTSPVVSLSPASQAIALPTANASVNMNPTVTGSSLKSVKWTKFKTPGQAAKTVVFLGSSTTAGVGASVPDSSYVSRFTRYYTAQGLTANVVNLGVSGYNPYNAMPTGYVAPASVVNALGSSVAAVDPTVNVTKALSFNPDIIVINFPNNGYDVLSTSDIMNGLQLLFNAAAANGAQVYITTTQPREDFSTSIQTFLQVIRDSILLRFGSRAIDFYDPIVVPGTTKRLYPSSADDVHDNDQGHRQLFNVVVGTNVFQNLISSASVIGSPSLAATPITGLTLGANLFQATVVDGHGQNISAVAAVTVNGAPPLHANAGPDQAITLPASQALLNGSASTGAISSYAWTQIAGPTTGTIVSPLSDSTMVNGLTSGVYVFQLTLNGDSSATVQVTVNTPPPPVANAGPAQTILLPVSKALLSGSASTGTITSYAWTQLSGPANDTIVSPLSDSTMITGLVEGVYVFQLALNGDSLSTVTITVSTPPLIANAGAAQTISLPTDHVVLSGSSSSGIITSFSWTQLSGPTTDTIVSPTDDSTMITGLTQGVYVFQLTLKGNSTDTVQVTVNAPPPPIANAGNPQTITLPASQVTLNANASTGYITSYAWTQISGPATDTIVSPTSDSTMITGLTQGVYVFQLTLNGDSSATVQITVNQPPVVANAGVSQSITLPANQVTLNGSSSSGLLTTYRWTETSGPVSDTIVSPSAVTTVVRGLVQGVYVFQLAVTDNLGTVKTDTMTVTVINGVVSKQINVNIYGGTSAYSNTQWNNWNVNNGVNSPTLTYSDGTSSGATASLSVNESVVDNGTTYGGTMAPPEVLRFTSYCETTRTLTLNTLKTGATYNIELYASRNSNSGQKSIFAIAGLVSDTILSFNNLTSKAVFSGVKASSGKIVITISTPTGYNYLNGFAITELTSSTGTTGGGESGVLGAYAASFGVSDSVTTALSGVQIYPNPARDQFTLNLNNEHTGAMRITIVNAAGVALRALESRKEGQISSTNIPVSGLASGAYFILVQVGDWRESRTLLKL